ncbi:hypothetical protein Zm00014a_007179 [Zea mays]|uniref:Uncharacterized protein n=1 Tax=Zea mays TaxID=4577 RepID=A0A3L6ECN7_MAIZE|nr:hypothetical protein Zm00014a_007179 [Zea mays]
MAMATPMLPSVVPHAMTTATVSLSGRRALWATPLPPVAALAVAGLASMTGRRHVGHEPRDSSQASTHGTWNAWPHRGSTRTFSPPANSPRQMAHTSPLPASSSSFSSPPT